VSSVIVVGDVPSFRRILLAALRSRGIEAEEADVTSEVLNRLAAQRPSVVIVHPPEGVFASAYVEQVTRVVSGARVFAISESQTMTMDGEGTVSYVSRVQVHELVEQVRRLTLAPPL
jgi:CheY-like chemotaxis protein